LEFGIWYLDFARRAEAPTYSRYVSAINTICCELKCRWVVTIFVTCLTGCIFITGQSEFDGKHTLYMQYRDYIFHAGGNSMPMCLNKGSGADLWEFYIRTSPASSPLSPPAAVEYI
jgi:hypothetical protein